MIKTWIVDDDDDVDVEDEEPLSPHLSRPPPGGPQSDWPGGPQCMTSPQ